MSMNETQEFQERIAKIDGLVQQLESGADPALKASARELLQAVLDLQSAGVERMLEIISKSGDAGDQIIRALARDSIVSSLLILYDQHPDDFETRVRRAAEQVRSVLAKHGASLEILSIAEGRVHVQVNSNGHGGCGSAGRDAPALVREALFEAAPDAVEVLIEGLQEQRASTGFVPLASLQVASRP